MVQGGVLGVELLPLILHVSEGVLGWLRAIKHGEAIAYQFAVVDQRICIWMLVRPGQDTMLISSTLRRVYRPVRFSGVGSSTPMYVIGERRDSIVAYNLFQAMPCRPLTSNGQTSTSSSGPSLTLSRAAGRVALIHDVLGRVSHPDISGFTLEAGGLPGAGAVRHGRAVAGHIVPGRAEDPLDVAAVARVHREALSR